ncbi:elafin [Manis javanica]|uniref:elafin n=1 Tax=Manis javanica TaxID=9974 RepID=UPI00187A767F|nr:elafin [Manis javanica]KAI5940422.1 Elafin [Manis javanica]
MRPSNSLVLGLSLLGVVFVTLVAEAAVTGVPSKGQDTSSDHVLVTGQDAFTSQDPIKDQVRREVSIKSPVSTKPGSCPNILIRCAMLNPPNRCQSDAECPGAKKCCVGPCGLACLHPQ